MRFKELNQETTQYLWSRWKPIIRETLDEFNEDVFHGRCFVRENNYNERPYLLLETNGECLYIFPAPGRAFVFGIYHHKIQKNLLRLNTRDEKPDDENLINWFGLSFKGVELHHRLFKEILQKFMDDILTKFYRHYWTNWL